MVSLSYTSNDLQAIAEKILDLHPDPVPRFRLLRDVLRLDPASPVYQQAQAALQDTGVVRLLESSQLPDGTWGRFHTQDTSVKQPFATTEAAIAAALVSGLDMHSPILIKTQAAILDYMSKKTCWPDPPEKHDNPLAWYVGVPHYSAAVLSQIDPFHPGLEPFWNLWAEAVQLAFQSGSYDRQKEIEALNVLMNCRMKRPVPFHSKYPMLILSATRNQLPADLERRVLEFVMQYPPGIYYTYDRPIHTPPGIQDKHFWGWTQAHLLLSRFRLWKEMAVDALNGIWAQRDEHGFWDLGNKMARKPFTNFPLSESWRRPVNRIMDYTVEMMSLLVRGL